MHWCMTLNILFDAHVLKGFCEYLYISHLCHQLYQKFEKLNDKIYPSNDTQNNPTAPWKLTKPNGVSLVKYAKFKAWT